MEEKSKRIPQHILTEILFIFAICTAVLLSSSTAYADNSTEITIDKPLLVKNSVVNKVAGPGISFTGTVEPANVAEGTIITDSNNITATVHEGPEGGVTFTLDAVFSVSEDLNASEAGETNTKQYTLAAHTDSFTRPGVYRYKFTDTTTNDDLKAAGVMRPSGYDNVRYIDIYVENGENDTLEITAYIVGADADNDGTLEKGDFTADTFRTYNVDLKAEVTGSMGDRDHEFPFAGTIVDSGRYHYYRKNNTGDGVTKDTNTSFNTALKHNDVYHLYGLSAAAVVEYVETNNASNVYKVQVDGKDDTIVEQTNVETGGTKEMSIQPITDFLTLEAPNREGTPANASEVTFINEFMAISPTGIAERYGMPIVFILLTLVLLIIGMSLKPDRKREE